MKDHLLTEEDAILNAMRKYKNAEKINQINQLNNSQEKSSHLVNYFNTINSKGQIPKSMGMIHRKGEIDQINL